MLTLIGLKYFLELEDDLEARGTGDAIRTPLLGTSIWLPGEMRRLVPQWGLATTGRGELYKQEVGLSVSHSPQEIAKCSLLAREQAEDW